MKGDTFRAALAHVGLDRGIRAAAFMGVSRHTIHRITSGRYEAPEAMAKLLKLMAAKRVTWEWFEEPQ